MNYLLGEKLKFDWKIVTITIVSTLLLMMDHYRKFTAHKYWDRVILYLVIPLLIIILFFRENPKEYGFSLGDWKAGSPRPSRRSTSCSCGIAGGWRSTIRS